MGYFLKLTESCGALALRSFSDGTIGAGAAKKILRALQSNKPVFELGTAEATRFLDVEQTRAKIREIRQNASERPQLQMHPHDEA